MIEDGSCVSLMGDSVPCALVSVVVVAMLVDVCTQVVRRQCTQ